MDELESHNCFFRAVVDQLFDLVTIADLEGTLLFCTPSIERLLGRAAHERVGRNLFEFVHPDDVDRVRGAFDEAVRSGESSKPIEYRCRHRDGDWRVLESIAGRSVDTSGVMLMLVQSRDATERSASGGQAAHATALQEAANLSGSIARDFGDLLVVLSRQVAMLETRVGAARGEVPVMRAALDRASALVSQLLAFAQLDEIRPVESTDVNRTLEEMAVDLDRVSGAGVEIIYLLGAAEPNVGLARTSLERVLVTLVARARDAMPRGGRLTILTRNTLVARPTPGAAQQSAEQVVIELTDTGVALTDDAKARIVEPARTSEGAEATLHQVHAILQKAGGHMAVDAGLHGGTTLRLQLPAVADR